MSNFFENTMQGLQEAVEIEQAEVPKHKKKAKSSTSKSNNKSKHKHLYEECLFIEDGHPHWGTYCSVCGKIGNVHFLESEKMDNGMWRALDYDEVYEKYKPLEQIQVDSIFQKFVPVSK